MGEKKTLPRCLRGWPAALMLQSVFCAAAAVLVPLICLSLPGAAVFYTPLMWTLFPLLGALSAFFATRAGLNAYLASFPPAILETALHWWILGYPPETVWMPLLSFLASLIGAATADTAKRFERKAQGKYTKR